MKSYIAIAKKSFRPGKSVQHFAAVTVVAFAA